jgi:hypothetical protein
MDWLLRIIVVWLSIDIVIFATVWYAVVTIKPYYPNWWRQMVVDDRIEF